MWRDVDDDDIGDGDGIALAELLREEALRERPGFSPAVHARFLRRQAAAKTGPVPTPHRAGLAGEAPDRRRAGRRWLLSLPMAAAAIAVLTSLLALPRAQRSPGAGEPMPRVPIADRRPAVPAEAVADPGLIERLPMFDELDRELRSGVVRLAASLLDLPAVPDMREFDPGGFLGAEPAR
ncbi:MAG: hypothetical protein RLZZ440_847 [Planctomycetota bacterium]|jgi:hypothetical protein